MTVQTQTKNPLQKLERLSLMVWFQSPIMMTPRVRLPDIVQMAGRLTSSCSCVQKTCCVSTYVPLNTPIHMTKSRSTHRSYPLTPDHKSLFRCQNTKSRASPTARAPIQSKSIVGMTNPSESRGDSYRSRVVNIFILTRMLGPG